MEQVIECLCRGFPRRDRSFWAAALDQMSRRAGIDGYPRFGHALMVGGRVVGVVLLIYSQRYNKTGNGSVYCNISSWCADKEYRSNAIWLHLASVKHKEVTYTNISPARHTRSTIEKLGFQRFTQGEIFVVPLLSGPRQDVSVSTYQARDPASSLLSKIERKILEEHADMGCRSVVCVQDQVAYPFVFRRRRILRGLIPCAQLVYCRNMADFVRFAHAIGRYLVFGFGPICVIDAAESTPSVVGWYYSDHNPKYFKGPSQPSVGDLSYTELALFGS